ncbi:E7 [Macaca fuscata papillomavirus 1]|uniref:Protein E7 n=1 Tax=Macaca fuscata papillomavirus 1 TaxID=1816787 RepID=A0A142K3F0_RHPV1|nr:E7 [Macaca fuscata papillomavirus 1]
MIGPKPTLQDIVLSCDPEPVDLYCHEELPDSSEDEDETDHHRADDTPAQECYRIVCDCHGCQSTLRLVVVSTPEDLRVLEDLLMGSLEILCPTCAGKV